jgi:hypothetical protein
MPRVSLHAVHIPWDQAPEARYELAQPEASDSEAGRLGKRKKDDEPQRGDTLSVDMGSSSMSYFRRCRANRFSLRPAFHQRQRYVSQIHFDGTVPSGNTGP